LKFLIDVGVGKKVELFLKEQGHDIKTVRTIDPQMPDEEIIRLASSEDRMIITMDKDFGELVYHSKMNHRGVLLLRLEDATGDEKQEVVANILAEYSAEIVNCFCVFQNDRLRIKKIRR
jgi:predicted nuclease of predicted toxin-antitoxin system